MRKFTKIPKHLSGTIIDFVENKGFFHIYSNLGLYLTLALDRRRSWDIKEKELVGKEIRVRVSGIDSSNSIIYIGELGEIKSKIDGKYLMT